MRGPSGPQTNICRFLCVVLVVIYLFYAIGGSNYLELSGHTKILPNVAHLEAHFANLGAFWLLEGP
jgi:hypothetical protein